MPKLFVWCELDENPTQIHEADPFDLAKANADGGWLTTGWSEDGLVEVRETDRHTALETWAESESEARARFMKLPIFAEYQE